VRGEQFESQREYIRSRVSGTVKKKKHKADTAQAQKRTTKVL
jgi:hypothetical protein